MHQNKILRFISNRYCSLIAILLLAIFLQPGCGKKKTKEPDLTVLKTGATRLNDSDLGQPVHARLIPTSIKGLFGKMMIMDSFLVCANLRDSALLDIYNLHTQKIIRQIVTRGNGPGECLGVESYILLPGKRSFWVYDITSAKLVLINLDKALIKKDYRPEREIMLAGNLKNMYSPRRVTDSLFSGGSFAQGDNRYLYFNTRSEITNKIGRLPVFEKAKLPSSNSDKLNINAIILGTVMEKHPEQDELFIAYKKTDRIEIYKNDSLQQVINGPAFFEPVQRLIKQGNVIIPQDIRKTKFAFVDITSWNNDVFCLYSGREDNALGNRIIVFDWNGRPQRYYVFDENIFNICIYEFNNEKRLYTVNSKNKEICYAIIN